MPRGVEFQSTPAAAKARRHSTCLARARRPLGLRTRWHRLDAPLAFRRGGSRFGPGSGRRDSVCQSGGAETGAARFRHRSFGGQCGAGASGRALDVAPEPDSRDRSRQHDGQCRAGRDHRPTARGGGGAGAVLSARPRQYEDLHGGRQRGRERWRSARFEIWRDSRLRDGPGSGVAGGPADVDRLQMSQRRGRL